MYTYKSHRKENNKKNSADKMSIVQHKYVSIVNTFLFQKVNRESVKHWLSYNFTLYIPGVSENVSRLETE